MKNLLLAGILGAGLALAAPVSGADSQKTQKDQDRQQRTKPAMSKDMQEAIAFERLKDKEDARQAQLEAKNPGPNSTNADRTADRTGDRRGAAKPAPKK